MSLGSTRVGLVAMLVVAVLGLNIDCVVRANPVDKVALCVEQVENELKNYTIPSSIDLYADSLRGWFSGEVDKISEVDKSDLPQIKPEECEQHMDHLDETLARIPCDEELSSSSLVEEYEFRMQESKTLGKILLGSLVCRDLLEQNESAQEGQ